MLCDGARNNESSDACALTCCTQREALYKAGKKPTDDQIVYVMKTFAKSQPGSMTFDEYQKMASAQRCIPSNRRMLHVLTMMMTYACSSPLGSLAADRKVG